jgi:rSAM/selenodomain-associated transferase 2
MRPENPSANRAARLSIIVPVFNEAGCIAASLDALAPLRARGHELIVVDGGSHDNTAALSRARADAVFEAPRGRARQMNAGAAQAHGQVLLFLHADTLLPAQPDAAIAKAISGGALWGRFDVHIAGRSRLFPLIATLMNQRSRWSGIATGDQAIFVERALFERIGGFKEQPLMEDIELSRRLRQVGRPACLRERVLTSGRRWEQHGVWRTIVLMWRLRWRYWRGTAPEVLAKAYR